MIFASTLVLALAVSSVPAAVGAPIGNRNFDVRAMRRALASNNAALAARAVPEHHSARSYVAGGGNDPRSANAGTANVNKREANPESTGTWRRERAKDNIPRYVRDAIPKKRAAEVKVESREEKVEARHPGHGHGHPHGKPEGSTDDGTTNPDDSQSTPESREVKVEARHPGHGHGHGPHGHPHGKPEGSSDDGTSNSDDSQSSPESREVKVETRHPHGHGHGHGPHGGPPGGGKGPSSSDDTTNPDDSQSSPESREVKVVKRAKVNWFGKPEPTTTGETTGRREVQGDSHQQQRRGPLGVIASFKRTLESLD